VSPPRHAPLVDAHHLARGSVVGVVPASKLEIHLVGEADEPPIAWLKNRADMPAAKRDGRSSSGFARNGKRRIMASWTFAMTHQRLHCTSGSVAMMSLSALSTISSHL
jgi:hypothetical protein